MASQTQTQPLVLPVFPGTHGAHPPATDELSFYEGTLRTAEGDGGLTLRALDVRPGCQVGDNFSSIVTRNTARGLTGSGTAFERSMIVKRAPLRDEFRCQAAFSKETDAYCSLVPALRRLCARAGLRLPLARCLHASRHTRPDLIVLEDLAAQGYAMRPRPQQLDAAHALRVMEALGSFHGASLSLRLLDARAFRQLHADTGELIFFPAAEDEFARTLRASTTLAVLSLGRSGRADLGQRLAARAARRGVFQEMCDAVLQPAADSPVPAVFTHGDCWANNLLFRYDADGRPCESRLIDLAGIRCSSPALDLLHFLYTSLPRDVRTGRLDQLLQHYMDALKATVRTVVTANQEPNAHARLGDCSEAGPLEGFASGAFFTLDELKEEMRRRSSFGLWMGLWMLPAVFFSPDILPAPDGHGPVDYFSEETQAYLCKGMPEEFHRRLLDLVEEHAENGTL